MSTLTYLNIENCKFDVIHPVWHQINCDVDIRKCTLKILLLIQRYALTTSPTAGTRRTDMCPLCGTEPETLTHFVLQCPLLFEPRQKFLKYLFNACRTQRISIDHESLLRIILDSTHFPADHATHENRCRNYLFRIHSARSIMLGGNTKYKSSKTFI